MAKLVVTQVRGLSAVTTRQRATVRGLGLRRIGHCVELPDTPAVRGLVTRVQHLVWVVALGGEAQTPRLKRASRRREAT